MDSLDPDLLWRPSPERISRAALTEFTRRVEANTGRSLPDYAALWQWSVDERDAFWREVWDYVGIVGERGERTLVDGELMTGSRWFPDASLNFAENLLDRHDAADADDALIFRSEVQGTRRISRGELRAEVSRVAAALKAEGVQAGDRVAGYLPNIPEAVIAMLGATSLGAIWSSCSPDFGVAGVLDRFGQIEPKILLVADGYRYNGKSISIGNKVAAIVEGLPGIERVVTVRYIEPSPPSNKASPSVHGGIDWEEWLAPHSPGPIAYARLPFGHPVYVLYSSGTTGAPKCIVHGAGGTLLQHLKEHRLQGDTGPGDHLFYFTTSGWMMWNWMVSALGAGATLMLFDGSPFFDRGRVLWDYADQEHCTHFGTSAKCIDALRKAALVPRKNWKLADLRTIYSTGSPLFPEDYDYVYQCIKADVCLSSISGGTDIVSCFLAGSPTLPVWRGEIQCIGLGMAVDVYDPFGRPVRGGKGELVCTRSFPSMPVGFWNDADGAKYRATYFERFPGVWCHGDYIELTSHGGVVVYGRSDATLNPGGVRIGTAEIYRQVERIPEVVESIVVGQNWPPNEAGNVRVVLFVRLRDGVVLDESLTERIRDSIRCNTTPRHVPARVLAVTDVPRTRSGKLVELAVRDVVHGVAVSNLEAIENPEALEQFRDRPELAT